MDYNKYSKPKKLISLVLLLVVCLLIGACNGQEESSIESVSDSGETAVSLTQSEALSLIERDKTATDMFINNSLCDGVATQSVAVTEGEYADFSAVENLLSSTYTEDGGNREFFKGYPENLYPSVSGIDGKTFVFTFFYVIQVLIFTDIFQCDIKRV